MRCLSDRSTGWACLCRCNSPLLPLSRIDTGNLPASFWRIIEIPIEVEVIYQKGYGVLIFDSTPKALTFRTPLARSNFLNMEERPLNLLSRNGRKWKNFLSGENRKTCFRIFVLRFEDVFEEFDFEHDNRLNVGNSVRANRPATSGRRRARMK